MVLDNPLPNTQERKKALMSLIMEKKLTSLRMLSEILEVDPDYTVELIKNLLSDGSLNGTFSEDETRFYSSYAKISSAPVILTESHEIVVFQGNSMPGKIGVLVGIFMLIAGSIVRGLVIAGSNLNYDAMGTATAMVGLLVLICGMLYISKQNPV